MNAVLTWINVRRSFPAPRRTYDFGVGAILPRWSSSLLTAGYGDPALQHESGLYAPMTPSPQRVGA